MDSAVCLSQEVLDALLDGVDKPARYTGGEPNSITKAHALRGRLALCFPDVYEVAESHVGIKILYDIVNRHADFAAERVYALWPDLEEKVRRAGAALWSLESRRALCDFDVVGFTLQYELSYPTLVAMLQLGRVPIRAERRGTEHPFVIGGGAGAFNPEPIAPFFDAFLLGDGEEAITEIMEVVAAGKERGAARAEILVDLAGIEGIYVPSHFAISYSGIDVTRIDALAGTPQAQTRSKHGTPRVGRRTLRDLDRAPYPTRPIVPNIEPIHGRVAIEIQRGCSQGCRFCQAGMITRPTRQRRPETVLKLAEQQLVSTGCDELGLLSLSAGDYGPLNEVLEKFFDAYGERRIGVSLPSLRTETMTPKLAEQVARVHKSGFTFAPEAGSERMRRVINKTNSEEDLMGAVRAAVSAGWRQLKFYFMIGLPTETDADVDAIAHVGERARAEGRKLNPRVDVTVSVSTFVPKPHTSFQWERQVGVEEARAKQRRLRERLSRSRIAFRYHSPEQSFIEGVLSRGDRRVADAIERAAELGCRLDAWSEHHQHSLWMQALNDTLPAYGLAAEDYLAERSEQALLPWDHLDAGILKKFLLRDRHNSYREGTLDDCAFTEHCYACGGCDLGDPYTQRKDAQTGERLVQLRPRVFERMEKPDGALVLRPRGTPIRVPTRLRFQYGKLGRAAHLSHLDVARHLLRALRQSGLPLRYTEGHRPRPRIAFSPACPLGVESRVELFDVDCWGVQSLPMYVDVISHLLPGGVFILSAQTLAPKAPAIEELIDTMAFSAALPARCDEGWAQEQIGAYNAASERWARVVRKRKPKLVDVKAAAPSARWHEGRVHVDVDYNRDGSVKISEILAAIFDAEVLRGARLRKENMILRDEVKPAVPARAYTGAPFVDLTALNTQGALPRVSAYDRVSVPYEE